MTYGLSPQCKEENGDLNLIGGRLGRPFSLGLTVEGTGLFET